MTNRRLFDAQLLTASFVYTSQLPLEADKIGLLVIYDPDEGASATGHVILEVSPDSLDTVAASSNWIQVGEVSSSSGTLTFAPRELQMVSTGAGTKKKANWYEVVSGVKYRVGIKESSVSADFGNMTVHSFTAKA